MADEDGLKKHSEKLFKKVKVSINRLILLHVLRVFKENRIT